MLTWLFISETDGESNDVWASANTKLTAVEATAAVATVQTERSPIKVAIYLIVVWL